MMARMRLNHLGEKTTLTLSFKLTTPYISAHREMTDLNHSLPRCLNFSVHLELAPPCQDAKRLRAPPGGRCRTSSDAARILS
jgi:hypothetical protein